MPKTKKFGEDEVADKEGNEDDVEATSDSSNDLIDPKDNEPEDEFSSMGCKFNPESFKKLKPKEEGEEELEGKDKEEK